jgi:hypothetical protein
MILEKLTLSWTYLQCGLDLTKYRIGAVPLEAYKNHYQKIDKYRFFSPIFKLLIHYRTEIGVKR